MVAACAYLFNAYRNLNTDMEFELRSYSPKGVKVVKSLGGAHLSLKSEGISSNMTVRAYFSYDLYGDFALPWTKQHTKQQQHPGHVGDNDDEDDFDNIGSFLRNFQFAAIFFILPESEYQREQLDDSKSFFHRAQRLVRAVALADSGDSSKVRFPITV